MDIFYVHTFGYTKLHRLLPFTETKVKKAMVHKDQLEGWKDLVNCFLPSTVSTKFLILHNTLTANGANHIFC